MPLLLKFHGALDTVTGSCHFFKVKASGNIYAVDCGATQGEDDDEQLALPHNLPRDCAPDKLSGIILTHAHGDHISHLPRWFQAGFRGQIFCSNETAKLAEIALQDGRKIESSKGSSGVNDRFFFATLEALKSAKKIQPGKADVLEHRVTIEATPTSHLLGCCAFRIEATHDGKTASVLYTGDIGPVEHGDETQSLYAERRRHAECSDYVISESTYGSRPRSKESQNGRRRQARVCEMLSKAFRHGDDSMVVIPAFSLQRSLDVLVDVFCALQYQRAAIGLSNSSVPLVAVHSGLSWQYAQVYRDFYFDELEKRCFFNEKSLLRKVVNDAGDDDVGVFNDLVPYGREKRVTRLDENQEEISTQIMWGKPECPAGRPTVIICASGMTLTGPITDLMDAYLSKDEVTFVLCGYVPQNSPGSQLRQIWPLSMPERESLAVKIPKDDNSGRSAKQIAGDAIKCGFDSLSEFYSGHADGPSIIRYILGDKLERAERTKGIFLVHGDKAARSALKELIHESCHKAEKQAPQVFCPSPQGRWFDCETGEAESSFLDLAIETDEASWAFLSDLNGVAIDKADTPPSSSFPDLIEIETSVILNNPLPADEAIDLIKGAFDFARPESRGDGLLLKFARPGRPHSTVVIEANRIGSALLKLSVQTRIKQAGCIEDIAAVSFDWRRLLNLLEVPKELYYAGVRWCETDAEVDRLLAISTPCVYGKKQRRQPVLILHKEMLSPEQLQSVERLLTPSVAVAVVHEALLSKINAHLGLEGDRSLNRGNALYLPIKFSAGAHSVTLSDGNLDVTKLAALATADTYILNTREPQLAGAGQPSPLTFPAPETTDVASARLPVNVRASTPVRDKSHLPLDAFLELAVGQKVSATVEFVRLKPSSGTATYALLRLQTPNLLGMLHCTHMVGSFNSVVGDTVEVWVRQVLPERREVVFTQHPVRLPGDALIQTLDVTNLSPAGIADILSDRASPVAACVAAEESLRLQGVTSSPTVPDTALERKTAIDTYNRLVATLGLVDTPPIPSPEPIKGTTYGDVAKELGYTLDDVVNAAGHMIGDQDAYQLGMAVLPAGFTPSENSAFPPEHKEAFLRECRERADKNWSKQLDLEAAFKPDCLSLASLAKSMGLTEAELLTLMSEKGIQPKVQVVLTAEDMKVLRQ